MNLSLNSSSAPDPGAVATAAKPPSLHWGIVLVLDVVTLGLFGLVWGFVEAAFARKTDPDSKALIYLAVSAVLYAGDFMLAFQGEPSARLVGLAGGISFLIAMYSIRDSIDLYYTQVHGIRQGLNGILVFFLGPIYLQYHLCKLAEMQRFAQLRSAASA